MNIVKPQEENPYTVDNARIKRAGGKHFKKTRITFSGYLWIGVKKDKVFTSTTLTQLVNTLKISH